MYFSGKALAKFASILYVVHDLARNPGLAAAGLQKLQSAFATFVDNQQIVPLAYDNAWGGVVSTAGLSGDAGADFGNSWYNDHHFHYGYFVYTAAVIAYLDPGWLDRGGNRAWVNMLVKDYASPVADESFPFSRSFDWWHGHSWAKGLFESADGKDQESTSEDGFASYAIKMWGKVIGDANMEARGMLSVCGVEECLLTAWCRESYACGSEEELPKLLLDGELEQYSAAEVHWEQGHWNPVREQG